MLKKILVPLDGSALGELALNYAAELAELANAEIHLVSICDHVDEEYRNMCGVYLVKVGEVLRSSLPGALKPDVRTVVIDGQPEIRILDYAAENDIDLIVLVSHGRSGIMPWATGGTAIKIIQKSAIPVLLIRASDSVDVKRTSGLFKKILVPLDGSVMAEAVLPYVKEIAGYAGSELVLLRVLEHGKHVRTIGGIDYFAYTEEQVKEMKRETVAYLDGIGRQLSGDSGAARTAVRTGDAAKAIIDVADQENVSLVAMSSHGKSAAIEWVLGSVSRKVLQAGRQPLLLVRPPENPPQQA